jgi:hypothetical protein
LINPGEKGMIEMRGESIQNWDDCKSRYREIRNIFFRIPEFLEMRMWYSDAECGAFVQISSAGTTNTIVIEACLCPHSQGHWSLLTQQLSLEQIPATP